MGKGRDGVGREGRESDLLDSRTAARLNAIYPVSSS